MLGVTLVPVSTESNIDGPTFVIGWLPQMAIVIGLIGFFANSDNFSESDDTPATMAGPIHLAVGILI